MINEFARNVAVSKYCGMNFFTVYVDKQFTAICYVICRRN